MKGFLKQVFKDLHGQYSRVNFYAGYLLQNQRYRYFFPLHNTDFFEKKAAFVLHSEQDFDKIIEKLKSKNWVKFFNDWNENTYDMFMKAENVQIEVMIIK